MAIFPPDDDIRENIMAYDEEGALTGVIACEIGSS